MGLIEIRWLKIIDLLCAFKDPFIVKLFYPGYLCIPTLFGIFFTFCNSSSTVVLVICPKTNKKIFSFSEIRSFVKRLVPLWGKPCFVSTLDSVVSLPNRKFLFRGRPKGESRRYVYPLRLNESTPINCEQIKTNHLHPV